MSLADRQRALIEAFSAIEAPAERFVAMVEHGLRTPPLPGTARTEAHRVAGCLSRIWLSGWLDESGFCQFRVEADSPAVRGVAGLLCELYSNADPAEVVAVEPDCLAALGMDQQLTPTRWRGIAQVRRRIREIAAGLRPPNRPVS